MRLLADFIMRGKVQACLVAAFTAALPMTYWISAASAALVLLRRGSADALSVALWALLPALLWWTQGEPNALLVIAGTLALASVLRSSASWLRVLLFSLLLGAAFGVLINLLFGASVQAVATEIRSAMPQVLGAAWEQIPPTERLQVEALLVPVLVGLMAAVLQLLCLLGLVLARYWQSLLYNPGGFAREFQAIRLPVPLALLLLLGIFLLPRLQAQLAMLTPLCSLPLAFAGLALLHGLSAQKGRGGFVLVGFYVALLMFMQVIYPLLVVMAAVDSLFDFRGRAARNGGGSSTGGEG